MTKPQRNSAALMAAMALAMGGVSGLTPNYQPAGYAGVRRRRYRREPKNKRTPTVGAKKNDPRPWFTEGDTR